MQTKILIKKIIIPAIILLVCSAYFLGLNSRRRLTGDALYWESQAALTKSLLSELKSKQAVEGLLKDQARAPRRLIVMPQNQDTLAVVKNYAQRMNIRIIDMKPDPGQPENNDTFILNSRVVKTFVIDIEAESGYMNLVRYFDMLYKVTPGFYSVEKLKISESKIDPDRSKVSMELRFYSL